MIRPVHVDLHVYPVKTRMPFRYGIAAMTRAPHLIVRLELEVGGKRSVGQAADLLPPKWFTKNPDSAFSSDLRDMLSVIEAARAHVLQLGDCRHVFDLWHRLYDAQLAWAKGTAHPPLLWHFGVSLMERAAIDAFCRATGEPFPSAVHRNTLGIDLGSLHPELAGLAPADLLPDRPLQEVRLRHTVGLGDPITDDDIPAPERLDDGLPQSLEANIRYYGLTHFKIKLSGQHEHDVKRLLRLAEVLERHVGDKCRHTLDGNEQFKTVEAFRAFWDRLTAEPRLQTFLSWLIFVEQPIHRHEAMTQSVGAAWKAWPNRPPTIIDESDGLIEDVRTALGMGYSGASHKNCKGVCKGIANACLIAHRRKRGENVMISGEDLANIGPIAMLQDLAVAATIGVDHVERNGHHYFRGLSQWPEPLQNAVLAAHADLYHRHPHGFPTLDVREGRLSTTSVIEAPFGQRDFIDVSKFPTATEPAVQQAATD